MRAVRQLRGKVATFLFLFCILGSMEGIELLENFAITLAAGVTTFFLIKALIARFVENDGIKYNRNLNMAVIPAIIGATIWIWQILT